VWNNVDGFFPFNYIIWGLQSPNYFLLAWMWKRCICKRVWLPAITPKGSIINSYLLTTLAIHYGNCSKHSTSLQCKTYSFSLTFLPNTFCPITWMSYLSCNPDCWHYWLQTTLQHAILCTFTTVQQHMQALPLTLGTQWISTKDALCTLSRISIYCSIIYTFP
jgi:hypothetical protein